MGHGTRCSACALMGTPGYHQRRGPRRGCQGDHWPGAGWHQDIHDDCTGMQGLHIYIRSANIELAASRDMKYLIGLGQGLRRSCDNVPPAAHASMRDTILSRSVVRKDVGARSR
jgi:hypothetical protein